MKQAIRVAFSILFSLALIGAAGWLLWSILVALAAYLKTLPDGLAAALVGGSATVIVATITVMAGRYFERKRELDALFREKKTEIYDQFLDGFFGFMFSNAEASPTKAPDDLVTFFRDFLRKLVLWSGPKPILAFSEWREHLAGGVPDAKTLRLTGRFLMALREDLGQTNKGMTDDFFTTLFLQNSTLFLKLVKQYPNLTLAQLAEIEQGLADQPPE